MKNLSQTYISQALSNLTIAWVFILIGVLYIGSDVRQNHSILSTSQLSYLELQIHIVPN